MNYNMLLHVYYQYQNNAIDEVNLKKVCSWVL